jgi:hypothetical protein
MVDTVICAGIAYSFYAIPYSMPTILKLDKKIISLQKKICGLPNCTPNVTTQLPHNLFGMEAFSIKNAYLRCIGTQLITALNDTGRLGIIYKGLTTYILAKHGGALYIPQIKLQDYVQSPITRTFFLLKHIAGIHLASTIATFPLLTTPLETAWMTSTVQHPNLNLQLSLKFLHKLLLHHITTIAHLTLPDGLHIMTAQGFQFYYTTPTHLIKHALDITAELCCHPPCFPHCPHPCLIHHPPHTLLPQYITLNHHILPSNPIPPLHPLPPPIPPHPLPPRHSIYNLIQYPITTILAHKLCKTIDAHHIIKIYTSYLCQ